MGGGGGLGRVKGVKRMELGDLGEEGIDPGERLALLLTGMLWLQSPLPRSAKEENGKAGTKTDRLLLT